MNNTILAIDYGIKNIGLAISDEYAKMALPYETIENKSVDFAVEEIKKIVEVEDVAKIIIGLPTSLQGKKSDSIGLDKFIENLKQKINLPIKLVDERMSSKAADYFKTDKHFKKSGLRDRVAASIILESYLSGMKK